MDMDPDVLHETWRSQEVQQVMVDAESLLNLVKRNHREFRSMIFRRDAIEVGTALVMTVVFTVFGAALNSWSWFVMAAACLFVAVFMLVDRRKQRRRSTSNIETLATWVERDRSDVEHQIWLLRNVFWWYLLPPLIGFTCVYGHHIWQAFQAEAASSSVMTILVGLFIGTCVFLYVVYLINQRAVRKELLPRLEELQRLAEGLTCDEAS